jgi:hypothetical protein
MKKTTVLFGFCFLLAASVLSAAILPDKAYEGPDRPTEELAVFSTLKSGVRMTLHKVDGVIFVPEVYTRSVVFEVYILPGTHTFEISLWGKGDAAVIKTVTFTAGAGQFYSLDGKTFTVRLGKGKAAPEVETQVADIPYYVEPGDGAEGAGTACAILEKGGNPKETFILFRIDGRGGHGAMNGNARFNRGFDDGAFTVTVTPGTHVLEYTATVKGWDYATGPKASSITVEAGKTYELRAVKAADGSVVVAALEKKQADAL